MTTTAIDPASSLADLVTAHPGLARELERRGLDYCCGGRRSLVDACRDVGLDAAAVAGELADVAGADRGAEPWAAMEPAELVDHLEAVHHTYLWEELPRLEALAAKVSGVHGERHPELRDVAALTHELRVDLESHLTKEERILFPMVRELAAAPTEEPAPRFHCGSLGNPISVMLLEHDRAGELLAELRRVTGAFTVPADSCGSYQALYAGLAELESDANRGRGPARRHTGRGPGGTRRAGQGPPRAVRGPRRVPAVRADGLPARRRGLPRLAPRRGRARAGGRCPVRRHRLPRPGHHHRGARLIRSTRWARADADDVAPQVAAVAGWGLRRSSTGGGR
jgi:regulator of cell morphogenesis and NO signaling